MRIFLSHISEEQPLALAFKDWIESTFPNSVSVFVSSDIRDIAAGDRWLHEIDVALDESQAFIVLCSPTSVSRPWINFETGSAWIKRVPVIPICHSGQLRSALPSPLSEFQALETNDASFVDDFLASLGKHLSQPRVPRIDSNDFRSDIEKAIALIPRIEQPSLAEFRQPRGLEEEAIAVLRKIADYGDRGVTLDQLAAEFRVEIAKMQYYLDQLLELRYTKRSTAFTMTPSRYRLEPEGRRFLVKQGLL